jgi:hypothetical protein
VTATNVLRRPDNIITVALLRPRDFPGSITRCARFVPPVGKNKAKADDAHVWNSVGSVLLELPPVHATTVLHAEHRARPALLNSRGTCARDDNRVVHSGAPMDGHGTPDTTATSVAVSTSPLRAHGECASW